MLLGTKKKYLYGVIGNLKPSSECALRILIKLIKNEEKKKASFEMSSSDSTQVFHGNGFGLYVRGQVTFALVLG